MGQNTNVCVDQLKSCLRCDLMQEFWLGFQPKMTSFRRSGITVRRYSDLVNFT